MNLKRKIRIGNRYGKLVVIADDATPTSHHRMVLFRCDCGKEKPLNSYDVSQGRKNSCGCVQEDKRITHGMSKTPAYTSWRSARARCNNPHTFRYENYGGRGICFSDRWARFEDFFEDMGERPQGTSLDRIDPDGHYEPGNCQWADRLTQARSRRLFFKQPKYWFKGVWKRGERFYARITVNDRTVRLGNFADEVSAARAYDEAALKYLGEKAVTNAMLGRY